MYWVLNHVDKDIYGFLKLLAYIHYFLLLDLLLSKLDLPPLSGPS